MKDLEKVKIVLEGTIFAFLTAILIHFFRIPLAFLISYSAKYLLQDLLHIEVANRLMFRGILWGIIEGMAGFIAGLIVFNWRKTHKLIFIVVTVFFVYAIGVGWTFFEKVPRSISAEFPSILGVVALFFNAVGLAVAPATVNFLKRRVLSKTQ
jgi:hypothetical protein